MPTLSEGGLAATVAVATNGSRGSKWWRFCKACGRGARWFPAFVWMLLWYVLIEYSVMNVREPFISIGGTFSVSWVEIIYLIAFGAAMLELLKVANPGQNDTKPIIVMGIVLFVYVVLFTISLVLWVVDVFIDAIEFDIRTRLFATSEFLMLVSMSAIQVGMAMWINSATLQRTISQEDHGN